MNTLEKLKAEFAELNWQTDIDDGLEGCKLQLADFDRMAADKRIEELREMITKNRKETNE